MYTFLETRIQSLHDGIFIVEKVLCVLFQSMLETSRCLYTGRNFKKPIGKVIRKLVTLFMIMTKVLQIKRFDANLSFG